MHFKLTNHIQLGALLLVRAAVVLKRFHLFCRYFSANFPFLSSRGFVSSNSVCNPTRAVVQFCYLPFLKVSLSCRAQDEPTLSLDKRTRTWLAKITRNKDKIEVQSTTEIKSINLRFRNKDRFSQRVVAVERLHGPCAVHLQLLATEKPLHIHVLCTVFCENALFAYSG